MTKKINDQPGFDAEILEIEDDLVIFLVNGMMKYSGRDPILSKSMVYFFTRKKLTQQKLQELTGFSAGTISKSIHQLLDLNLIKKEFIEGTHEHIYIMDELPYAKPSYIMNMEILLGGISDKLDDLNEKMDSIKEYKDEIEGYERVNSILIQITRLIKSAPQFVEIFKKELEAYLKNYPQFS